MATISEDYVSFETAKLLKDKGFNEHCFCINYPLPEGEHHDIILPNLLNNSMIPFTDEYKFCRYKEDFITIPTLQMTMKWLREVHKLHIEILARYHFRIFDGYSFEVYNIKDAEFVNYSSDKGTFKTYEEAAESSIKYCLENLI